MNKRTTLALSAMVLMCMVSSVAEAQNGGGTIMPPSATPKGFSLSNMAALNAPFVTSGNDLKYYPDAPFQTLYVISPSTTNTFHVRTGTMIYMPIFNADDSPPILLGPPLGHFPTNHDEAVFYWSDKSQLGLSQTVTVDGRTTDIPTDYVAGPLTASLHNGPPQACML